MARNPNKRRCSAVNKNGKPCQNYARADSDRCRQHAPDLPAGLVGAPAGNDNRRIHGLYAKYMTEDDLASLALVGSDPTLADEIAFTRVVIRRLASLVDTADSLSQAVLIADALLRGTRSVAALLKAQRAISGDAADGIAGAIGAALDEIGNLYDLKL